MSNVRTVCFCLINRQTGQVGYIVMGMRKVKEAFIGDTFHHPKSEIVPLPGFAQAKPMVIMCSMKKPFEL